MLKYVYGESVDIDDWKKYAKQILEASGKYVCFH